MAPKMKAKAKPKARGLAKAAAALRRPARAVPLRRPGAVVELDGEKTSWESGGVVRLCEVPLEGWMSGVNLIVDEGFYFGKKVKVAGQVDRMEVKSGRCLVHLKLSGTDSEDILKAHGSSGGETFTLHLCPPDCGHHESGDRYIHCPFGRQVLRMEDEAPWATSLMGVPRVGAEEDELRLLRQRERDLLEGSPGGRVDKRKSPESKSSSSTTGKKKKKKKKKKKLKKADKEKKEEGRKTKEELDGRHAAKAAGKKMVALFGGTGLDPQEEVRRRVLRRARRYVSKKGKEKSSSSSSQGTSESSVSHEEHLQSDDLYSEAGRSRAISQRFPGILTLSSMKAMRETLLQDTGVEGEEERLQPVATQYYKQHLARRATPAMNREMLTLVSILDCLIKARPSHACDIASQRLKSLENIMQGVHWTVAQKLEVPIQDYQSITAREELRSAQRETFQENRTLYLAGKGAKGPGDKGKGAKGDYKGDKGEKGDNVKGKGKKGDKEHANKEKKEAK